MYIIVINQFTFDVSFKIHSIDQIKSIIQSRVTFDVWISWSWSFFKIQCIMSGHQWNILFPIYEWVMIKHQCVRMTGYRKLFRSFQFRLSTWSKIFSRTFEEMSRYRAKFISTVNCVNFGESLLKIRIWKWHEIWYARCGGKAFTGSLNPQSV